MITIISFHFNWCRRHRNNFLCPATHSLKWLTISSLHHLPTQFFREKLFLEKGPDSRNNPYCFRIWIRRNTQLFFVSYEDAFYSLWVRAYQPETFSHKRRSHKPLRNDDLGFSKPKLSFLKVWGCDAYVKKLQPDKLEPKSDKCVFIGYPKETVGYTFYHRSEGKSFAAKNGPFL